MRTTSCATTGSCSALILFPAGTSRKAWGPATRLPKLPGQQQSQRRRRQTKKRSHRPSQRPPPNPSPWPPRSSTRSPVMSDPRQVIRRPVVSEKSYALLDQGVYTFVVAPDANKIEIRHAIEAIFGVNVVNVNTLNRPGKRKRNRKQQTFGKRADTKRAMVTLAPGQSIPIFEGN